MKTQIRGCFTFQVFPECGIEALILLEYNQQAVARTAQCMDGAPEAQKQERKKPPHLGSLRARRREMEERGEKKEKPEGIGGSVWRFPVVTSKLACSMYSQSGDVLLRMPRPELDPRFAIPQRFRSQVVRPHIQIPSPAQNLASACNPPRNEFAVDQRGTAEIASFPIGPLVRVIDSASRFLNPDTTSLSKRFRCAVTHHSHDVGSAILVGASALPSLGLSREACDFLFDCCRLFRPCRAGHPASYPTVFRIRRPRANSSDISEYDRPCWLRALHSFPSFSVLLLRLPVRCILEPKCCVADFSCKIVPKGPRVIPEGFDDDE